MNQLYGWEEAFVQNVLNIRKKELHLIRKSGFYSCVMVVMASNTSFIVALTTFTFYILMDPVNNHMNAEKVFVSLALFSLLRMPLKMVPNMITTLVSVMVIHLLD